MGLFVFSPVAADLAFPLHEVLKRDIQFVVGGLVRGLGLHLLVVLVGDTLGDDLIRGRLLLLAKGGDLAIDGGGLGGQLLHRALIGSRLDLRESCRLLLLQRSYSRGRVLNHTGHICVLILNRGERGELRRVKRHRQSAWCRRGNRAE